MTEPMKKRIPVILDTDIGGDVDDTWALIMLLNSPEVDIKLITSAVSNTTEKACIIAKLLEIAGRTDIPIGVGLETDKNHCNQADWVKDYSLENYPGTVYYDGVDAIVNTIRASEEKISLTCLGSLPNIGEALKRAPDIVNRARFVGMHGSIYSGYAKDGPPCPESNVRYFTPDCQAVFQADWEKIITPLDTCALVTLEGDDYKNLIKRDTPLIRALMENNKLFAENVSWIENYQWQEYSSCLFDTVAVFLIYSTDFLEMRELPIVVTDDGMTVVSDEGNCVNCAINWTDLDAFKQHLISRIK